MTGAQASGAATPTPQLARWSRISALGRAMLEQDTTGSEAVSYLRHALGVSRTRAYELLRGDVEPSEEQLKVLEPHLGRKVVGALVVCLRAEADQRALHAAEYVARTRGNADLADRIAAFVKAIARSDQE